MVPMGCTQGSNWDDVGAVLMAVRFVRQLSRTLAPGGVLAVSYCK